MRWLFVTLLFFCPIALRAFVDLQITDVNLQVGESPPTGTSESTTTSDPLRLLELELTPSSNTVQIVSRTNWPTQLKVAWGETAAVRDGVLTAARIDRRGALTLSDLKPATTYYLELTWIRPDTGESITETAVTVTTPLVPIPQNVFNFQATLEPDQTVLLTWAGAEDVRLTRSEFFFPHDPLQGKVIFEGAGYSTRDVTPVRGKINYYAIFTRTEDNHYSLGALAFVYVPGLGESTEVPALPTEPSMFTPLKELIQTLPDGESFVINQDADLYGINEIVKTTVFTQGNTVLKEKNGGVTALNVHEQITLRVPEALLPRGSLFGVVTLWLSDFSNPVSVLARRPVPEKEYLGAELPLISESGVYPMVLVVYDHTNTPLALRGFSIVVPDFDTTQVVGQVPLEESEKQPWRWYYFMITLDSLLLLYALVLVREKRRKRAQKTDTIEEIEFW